MTKELHKCLRHLMPRREKQVPFVETYAEEMCSKDEDEVFVLYDKDPSSAWLCKKKNYLAGSYELILRDVIPTVTRLAS